MFVRSSLAISLFALAACGDDGGTGMPDAPRQDAQTSKVMEVTCPATTPVTFTTFNDLTFEPKTATINLGQIVKFVSTSFEHPIVPIPGDSRSDSGLVVGGMKTKCFNFLATGVFTFKCMQHQYVGMLTVN